MFVSSRIVAGSLFVYDCVKLEYDSVVSCEVDMQKASDWNYHPWIFLSARAC